jgi:hypothetical protein
MRRIGDIPQAIGPGYNRPDATLAMRMALRGIFRQIESRQVRIDTADTQVTIFFFFGTATGEKAGHEQQTAGE